MDIKESAVAETNLLDLSSLDAKPGANKGALMTLRHPATNQPLRTAKGESFVINLLGMDSEVYKRQTRLNANARLAMKGRMKLKAEELEAEGIETLAACTIGWTDGLILDGKEFNYSPANAVTLYTRFAWAKEQADEFIGDRSNHLGNS